MTSAVVFVRRACGETKWKTALWPNGTKNAAFWPSYVNVEHWRAQCSSVMLGGLLSAAKPWKACDT